jgi:TonB family protein
MSATTSLSFGPRPADVRGSNRAITWSVAVHLGALVAVMLMPREWFAKKPAPPVMTISLGGTPGPKSTGTTSMGGRTVEQVAPPPRRPAPVPPVPKAAPAPVPMPVKSPPRAATPRPAAVSKPPPMPPVRAPIVGAQVTTGNTAVDTGARGQGAGLTFGGGGMGGETDLQGFCCPEYLQQLLGTIDAAWNKNQPEHGTAILKFTIQRSGAITDITIEQGSGYGVLDRAARAALLDARLPRLPAAYVSPTLTVHLKFPYGTP